jgi:hypothetical protein
MFAARNLARRVIAGMMLIRQPKSISISRNFSVVALGLLWMPRFHTRRRPVSASRAMKDL